MDSVIRFGQILKAIADYAPFMLTLTLDANWRWPGPGAMPSADDVLDNTLEKLPYLTLMRVSDRVVWSPNDSKGISGLRDAIPSKMAFLHLLHPEFGLSEYFDEEEAADYISW